VISYNLGGLNDGHSMLPHLCCDVEVAIIALLQHLLTRKELYTFNEILPDLTAHMEHLL
jgi:hypothetical protein